MTRLLYLGFSFPPGVQALCPGVNPAGHGLETQMIAALRSHFDIKSATVLPVSLPPPPGADSATGVAHDLVLLEKPPELFHRWQSWRQLKQQYQRWLKDGYFPEALLVYNLSPIYNQFVRWLRRQRKRPRLVLMLLDSSQLGKPLPFLKRFRYRFKPFTIPDQDMLDCFDACIGLSRSAEGHFSSRKIPFLWVPGGCVPRRSGLAVKADPPAGNDKPIAFAYFGALAPHSGVAALIETFLRFQGKATLHICGFGQLEPLAAKAASQDSRVIFHGLLTQDECIRAAADWDVLVNPRPASHGNENNFPSKIFEYALCGRAILTTRMAGVDEVLGAEASYIEPSELEAGLAREMDALSRTGRGELRRRGAALRERVVSHYSWTQQAAVMAEFIEKLPLP